MENSSISDGYCSCDVRCPKCARWLVEVWQFVSPGERMRLRCRNCHMDIFVSVQGGKLQVRMGDVHGE